MKFLMLGLMLLPAAAMAHEYEAGSLVINHPWTRATPAGSEIAVGYLSVVNKGETPDWLVDAEVDGVGHVMIHETVEDEGIAKMEHVDKVMVAPGETVDFRPGGLHLMWMDMKKPLKEGQGVNGVLVFERAGRVTVSYKVEAAGALVPAGMEPAATGVSPTAVAPDAAAHHGHH
ncbi:MAG: copper chaperone PCu(A)C [Alphaproteobacteria bacterium]|nr:MAG: copper chaperone PCu(A)C [Alphaproteobacteria bacterium]